MRWWFSKPKQAAKPLFAESATSKRTEQKAQPKAQPGPIEFDEDFDEEAYLDANPDVAKAVRSGNYPSGRIHYQTHGRREGRLRAPVDMAQRRLERETLREALREALSRDDFLAAAVPTVTLFEVSHDHPRFPRMHEILNNTNQFNTTGQRWTPADLASYGLRMFAFDAKDAYTRYGMVGVVLTSKAIIEQCVMSCRVLDYEIENAVMAMIIDQIRWDRGRHRGLAINGRLIKTKENFPCHDLYERCGFVASDDDMWILPADNAVSLPPHVVMNNSLRH